MSVMVVLTFPCPFHEVVAWVETNGAFLAPINDLFTKHGRISHHAGTSETAFIDFDLWPSREAYAAFKAEAAPYIEKFESAFGHSSTEQIWDMVE